MATIRKFTLYVADYDDTATREELENQLNDVLLSGYLNGHCLLVENWKFHMEDDDFDSSAINNNNQSKDCEEWEKAYENNKSKQ